MLAATPGSATRRRVLDAINALAHPAGASAGRSNPALAKRCLPRHMETGSSAQKCSLLEALETMPDLFPDTECLRAFIRSGVLPKQGMADPERFVRKVLWMTDGCALQTVPGPARPGPAGARQARCAA
jgi:hypothetical protein